ncbi:MAG: Stk1 family PASTA domain-containing Ser/Thr kinase [Erysipelotrichaceae bacterium]|nr:Stk1 family PASTA domain-containing Ser/Thr kinase [Erysipelotrichaceae bacterium]
MSDNMIQGRYKVVKHIGQGGMADVFVAIDTILNREVAIKVLRGELSNDPVSVLRFKREANASTLLSHPNIVDIYDVGEYKGHHYIVMEYVKGKNLKQLITQRGALIKEEAVDIMKQLCGATIEAHNRGIIHRDIKPQNVLVMNDGTIKMVDFGIALAQGALQLTQSDSIMGSVHYLAPELAKGEQATMQSDIYSLGIVFYELLTGDVPFKADQAVQVALMQMRNEIPSVREINPSIPQSIENIIIRATAKNKGFRYQNVEEMLDDLKTCLRPERQNEKKNVFSFPEEGDKTVVIEKVKQSGKAEEVQKAKKVKKGGFNPVWLVGILVSLLIVSGIYFLLSISGVLKPSLTMLEVPNIIGMDVTSAKNSLDQLDLILDTTNITYQLTDDTPKGKIISVNPEVGSEISKETTVSITVSSGIAAYIGDYAGMKLSDAKKDLAKYSNVKIILEEEESEDVAPGVIIRQELLTPGMQFNPEVSTDIKLIYSKYTTIVIPWEISDMQIEDATTLLQNMGVEVMLSALDTSTMSDEEMENLRYGVVIQTTPAVGTSYTQEDGSNVVIYYY